MVRPRVIVVNTATRTLQFYLVALTALAGLVMGVLGTIGFSRTDQMGAVVDRSVANHGVPFSIRNRQIFLLGPTLLPKMGDHDVISIIMENSGAYALYNLTVLAEMTSAYTGPSVIYDLPVMCPGTGNQVVSVIPAGGKVLCTAIYMLAQGDIDNLSSLTVNTTVAELRLSAVSTASLDVGSIAVTPAPDDDVGFLHGQCNYTSPPAVGCDSMHHGWTFLCEEQQALYTCSSNGTVWVQYFDLASATTANAYTQTLGNYMQPICGGTVILDVVNTAWMAGGQIIYVQGGGYYVVTSITNTMMVTIMNPCFTSNAAPGTLVPSPAAVTPAGQEGPSGPSGPSGETFVFFLFFS